MPHQELFFEQSAGDRQIQVLKTNDQSYAREAFDDIALAITQKRPYRVTSKPAM